MNPEITVIIPAWNLDDVLRECVSSLKNQDTPFELLIVNNASDKPLPQFPDAEELRLEKRVTIGAARNAALEKVRTPYVLFMDADDKLLPNVLGDLLRRIKNPGVVLAASGIVDWNPETDARRPAPFPPAYALRIQKFRYFFGMLNAMRYCCTAVGSALISTEVARAVGGFADANYGEDWIFSVGLPFQGKVDIDRKPAKLYRLDSGATTLASEAQRDLANKFRTAMHGARKRLLASPNVPVLVKLAEPLIVLGQNIFYQKKIRTARRHV